MRRSAASCSMAVALSGTFRSPPDLEPLDDRLEIGVAQVLGEDFADGGANQFARDGVGAFQLAFVFEFQLAGDGGNGGVDVGDARGGVGFVVARGALLGAADHGFHAGDGQALADAGALVDALIFARQKGDLLDDFAQVVRHVKFAAGVALGPGFLRGDGHAFFDGGGIVRADFAADAVLERRDDFAARGVVLGIGGEDQQHVERQANRVALNLHVAFLHDVEKADLNFAGEVGQFVDGEDAAIGARQQAVVHGELVAKVAAAAGGLDGIDVADDVGDGHVGRG